MKLKELKYERFILSTRPVLWLPLYRKDGDTILSSDGYGHLCTVTGALWTPQGRTFDGASYISIPNHASLNITEAISLEAWVYYTVTGQGFPRILAKGGLAGAPWQIYGLVLMGHQINSTN